MEGNRFILCTCRAHPSNSVEVLGLCRQSFHWLASGVGRWHWSLFGSPGGSIGVQAQILLHPHGQVGHKVSLLGCHSPRHMLLAWQKLGLYPDGYAHLFAAWRSRMERLSTRRIERNESHLEQFTHCYHVVFLAYCDKIRFGRSNFLQRVAPRSLGYWQYCPRYKKPDGLCVFPYLVQFFKSRLFSFLSDHYCPLCSGDCILVRHLVFTVERNSTSLDTFEQQALITILTIII